jgi:hypothetical protein
MSLDVFLAFQLAFLPIQMILFYGVYSERKKQQLLLRFAVLRLQNARR